MSWRPGRHRGIEPDAAAGAAGARSAAGADDGADAFSDDAGGAALAFSRWWLCQGGMEGSARVDARLGANAWWG